MSDWRRLVLDGKLVLPAPDDEVQVEFAPVVFCDAGAAVDPPVSQPEPEREKVEIVFRGVSIKLGADTAAARIAEIARAVGVVE